MEQGNHFIYIFQIKISESFFVHFAFYISNTCTWYNLGKLSSEMLFWNRKAELCKEQLWRLDSL